MNNIVWKIMIPCHSKSWTLAFETCSLLINMKQPVKQGCLHSTDVGYDPTWVSCVFSCTTCHLASGANECRSRRWHFGKISDFRISLPGNYLGNGWPVATTKAIILAIVGQWPILIQAGTIITCRTQLLINIALLITAAATIVYLGKSVITLPSITISTTSLFLMPSFPFHSFP